MVLECPPEQVQDALERVLSNRLFSRSEQLQKFLRYVVEQEIAGRGEQITEAVLANDVFNRTLAQHQGTSIVRTEANRLRGKLAKYYDGPGSGDAVRIVVARGAYRPSFERLEVPPRSAPDVGLRVLVGPLRAPSGEPEAELLAVVVAEALARTLDGYRGVTTIGAMSSELAAKAGDALPAGGRLGADRIVSGQVEVSRGIVTIAVSAGDRDGHTIWEGRSSRPVAASRDAGAELARQIAQTLAPDSRSAAAPAKPETVRPEALLLVERGYVYARRRTRRYLEESLRYFNAALALEEDGYARAWAGRSEALMLLDMQSKERLSNLAQAKRSALKAVELDPSLWEGHAILASLAWHLDWSRQRMESAFQHCLHLDPARTEGYHYYWFLLGIQGRLDEAIRLSAANVARDPLNFLSMAHLSYLQVLDCQYDEALQTASKAKALMPGFYLVDIYAALAAAGLGDWQSVYDYASRADALADGSTNTIGAKGFGAAKLGRTREARYLLEQAIANEEPCHQVASILCGLGEPEAACEWLERGVERQETILLHLRKIPLIAAYVDYPRLTRLLDRIDKILAGGG